MGGYHDPARLLPRPWEAIMILPGSVPAGRVSEEEEAPLGMEIPIGCGSCTEVAVESLDGLTRASSSTSAPWATIQI